MIPEFKLGTLEKQRHTNRVEEQRKEAFVVWQWRHGMIFFRLSTWILMLNQIFFFFLLLTERHHHVILSSPRYQIFHLEQTRARPAETVIGFWIFGDMQWITTLCKLQFVECVGDSVQRDTSKIASAYSK